MSSPSIPKILLIDDDADESLLLPLESAKRATVRTLHPNEVEPSDLREADLVLVDYGLDRWPERDNLPQLCLRPVDGLALSALLRRHARRYDEASPTAFAIYTGQIETIASPLPPENRLHALAALTNLEWVFSKGTPGDTQTLDQIAVLAESVTRLPPRWANGDAPGATALDELCGLLAVAGTEELSARLRQEVEDALPPIHELSQWSHGLAVLRWLLQRVFPYPCFLWPISSLAARLRIEWPAIADALRDGMPLRRALIGTEYAGILRGFSGLRWWRASVELWLWDNLAGQASNDDAVYDFVCRTVEVTLPRSSPNRRPLVCLNRDFEPSPQFSSIDDAVRIRPDGWPSYAEQAWVTLQSAIAEPQLGAIVMQEDRERIRK